MKIYHNRNCSKSCAALDLLQENGIQAEIKEYVHEALTREELKELLEMLQLKPLELIRQKEALFQAQFAGQQHSDEEWIDIMIAHPILIERPIVVSNGQARIGRPVERILELL